MDRHVAMSLLKTVVLLDVMEVITSDDNGPLHLHLLNDTGEDATTDGNVTSEWAFLVDVGSFDRLQRKKVKIQELIIESFAVSVTSRGVLNPRPTLRWYLRFFFTLVPFRLRKTVGCFWNDFSFYTTQTTCKGEQS